MRWLAVVLLVGCTSSPPPTMRTDAAVDADAARDTAPPVDVGLPWEVMGCELSATECPENGGPDAFCASVHEYIAEAPSERRLTDCPQWAFCPGSIDCWMCPNWSIRPLVIDMPSPRPDAGLCFPSSP